MKPSKLITYFIAVALTVLTGVAMATATDWAGPTAEPPANNTPAPLNVGSAAQTKTGSLTVGSDLIINGKICLGGVCLNAWPDATTVVAPPAPPVGDVVNGVCGAANGQTVVAAPTADLCTAGIASTVSNAGATWSWICNGSGGGVSSPCNATIATGWVSVLTANIPAAERSNAWFTEKTAQWTANGPIYAVRVSGDSDDGGYCYASWGTGNIATWRHDPSVGVYNVDNSYHDGGPIYGYDFVADTRPLTVEEFPTCQSGAFWAYNPVSDSTYCAVCPAGQTLTAFSDENSTSYACLKGYNTCPTNPALFTNDGTAKICQNPYSAGGLTTKSLVNMRPVPLAGNVFKLKSNFVDGPGNGHVNCKMEVMYK